MTRSERLRMAIGFALLLEIKISVFLYIRDKSTLPQYSKHQWWDFAAA
jgi:hypothetical protein